MIDKKEIFFDNRISQRSIREGKLKKEDYEDFLSSLPDLASSCEDISENIFGSNISGISVRSEYRKAEHDDEI
jgi:hypothetical protein